MEASTSCVVIRTRLPERKTAPSITASTFSSRAITGSALCAPLYCMAEVREITRRALILPKSVMSASVIPSAKYSCSGSFDRFSSGSTARDRMRPAAAPPAEAFPSSRSRNSPAFRPKSSASSIAAAVPPSSSG